MERRMSALVAAADKGLLHFPAQKAIADYLAKHPLTKDIEIFNPKINEAVARAFDKSIRFPMAVKTVVMMTMYDVSQGLNLSEADEMMIRMNLTLALQDCANGKQIQLNKTKN
jgi:hypothetical protein